MKSMYQDWHARTVKTREMGHCFDHFTACSSSGHRDHTYSPGYSNSLELKMHNSPWILPKYRENCSTAVHIYQRVLIMSPSPLSNSEPCKPLRLAGSLKLPSILQQPFRHRTSSYALVYCRFSHKDRMEIVRSSLRFPTSAKTANRARKPAQTSFARNDRLSIIELPEQRGRDQALNRLEDGLKAPREF